MERTEMAQATQSLSPNLDLPIFPRYPGVAFALARYRARRIVECELRSQGLRVSHIPYKDVMAQAMEYLRDHRELTETEVVGLMEAARNRLAAPPRAMRMKRSSCGDASDFTSTGPDDTAAADASATTTLLRLCRCGGCTVASVWP
jgi:hypothetical protein